MFPLNWPKYKNLLHFHYKKIYDENNKEYALKIFPLNLPQNNAKMLELLKQEVEST